MKYEIKKVHVSTIKPGDTVMHNGEMKTVIRNNIKTGGFFGVTLFGDSYRAGSQLVEKVIIYRAMPNNQWVAA
jgi:hypothetical protein